MRSAGARVVPAKPLSRDAGEGAERSEVGVRLACKPSPGCGLAPAATSSRGAGEGYQNYIAACATRRARLRASGVAFAAIVVGAAGRRPLERGRVQSHSSAPSW